MTGPSLEPVPREKHVSGDGFKFFKLGRPPLWPDQIVPFMMVDCAVYLITFDRP